MNFYLDEQQLVIRHAIEKICDQFDDDYWFARDADGEFPEEAASPGMRVTVGVHDGTVCKRRRRCSLGKDCTSSAGRPHDRGPFGSESAHSGSRLRRAFVGRSSIRKHRIARGTQQRQK